MTDSEIEVTQGGTDTGIQRRSLSGVLGAEDDEELEVLGRAMMYTVGEVQVPRDWLLQRCRDLGIPERLVPGEPSPYSAYTRAMSRLVSSKQSHKKVQGRRVEITLHNSDGHVKHLQADVHFSQEEVGEAGGRWEHHDLGHFDYDADAQRLRSQKNDSIPDALVEVWEGFQARARHLFQEMQNSHTGDDIRHMVYLEMILNSPPDWPDIIKLRDGGSVYFVPEGPLTDVLESMATLFSEIGQKFKEGGKEVEIRTLEVVDSEDKRDWIESRVEAELDGLAEDVIDEAFEALDENEDWDEIVDNALEQIDAGDDMAQRYNQLLQAGLDLESKLEARKEELKGDKEELVEGIVERMD